ncbi:hypothetical protein Golax_021902, partial [Gossypium laxum]|nr:hypothetical protein [Gossypium laxum]
ALHVLRDCPFTKDIWNQVIPSNQHRRFFNGNLSKWLLSNLCDQMDNSTRGSEIIKVSYSWERDWTIHLDALHVLRDCPFANDIWNQVIPSNQHRWFFNGNLSEWLLYNLRDQLDNSTRGSVVAAISNRKLEGSNSTFIRQIRQILSVEERWCLRYVPRENNKIAYALVKMALSNVEGLHMIEDPHIEIQEVIREDNARGNLQKNMNM